MQDNIPVIKNSFAESSVIQLLKRFSRTEINELERFIMSPFHNNRKEVTKFFKELKSYYPAFDPSKFTKEKIYSNLYPEAKYRDDIMRRLSSNLFKLCQDYGAYKMFRDERFDHNRYLLEFHLSTYNDALYSKQKKKADTFLEEQPLRDAKYFLHVNFLEELKRVYQIKSDPLGKKINIQKQIDSVWKYSIITLLRLYKIAVENTKQFNKKYDTKYLMPLLKIIENSDFLNSKAVEIWYFVIKFHIGSRSDETFYRLKKLLSDNFKIFDPIESFIIHVSLLSYCYDMNVMPAKNFHKEEFEIIFQMLKAGLLIENETMYSEWFMYAFLSALRAGEVSFAEKFVNDYKDKIHPNERKNVINHAIAELAIEKKEFEKALKYLSVPKYNNVAEKLRSNQMYLKIYYELGLSEPFFYNADSFKHFIKDEASLSKDIKNIRENFINFTSRLFKLKLNFESSRLKKLKKEIMDSRTLGNKWLLAKVKELEEKKK